MSIESWNGKLSTRDLLEAIQWSDFNPNTRAIALERLTAIVLQGDLPSKEAQPYFDKLLNKPTKPRKKKRYN